ncbi:hypothetical protein KIPB_015777, partial [Kipferlia bialata]
VLSMHEARGSIP